MIFKKYKLIIIAVLWCIAFKAYTQHVVDDRHYPDSLQNMLRTADADTAKADILFLLSDYWADKDTVKALQYARESLQLINGNDFYKGIAHFYIAGIYFDHNIELSQQEYMYAEELLRNYQTPGSYQYQSRAWHNYGALEQRKDNNKNYTDILLNKAIPLAQKAGDSTRLAADYMDVGVVFMNLLNYDKALQYYERAITILRHTGKVYAELADCYTNSAKAYILNKNYPAAKPCLDSAFKILSPNPQSAYLPVYYCMEGMYYNRINQWDAATASFNKGLQLAEKLNMQYDALSILFEQYNGYKAQKKYPAAKQVLLKVYKKVKLMPLEKNKRLVLFELSQTEADMGNIPAAYKWLMEYTVISDSVFSAKTTTEIAELETRYRSSEKEKQILTLQNDKKQQQLTLQRNHFITTMLVAGLIAMFVLLFFSWRLYLNKKRSAKQQQLLHEQNMKDLQQKEQIKVYDAMLQGQEQERTRVARDLHDGLGGMLAGVKLKLSTIAGKEEIKKTDMELYKVITQLDQSVNELRRIARNMMPETLLQLGLEPALKDLCASLETAGLKIDFEAPGLGNNIPQPVQITVYRIIQELLSNAIRHSQAGNILVQCSQNEEHLFITVEDDGNGFNPGNVKNKTGIGLSNIKNRVEFLKGKFEINSLPGEGTTVNIEVSIHE